MKKPDLTELINIEGQNKMSIRRFYYQRSKEDSVFINIIY